MGVSQEKGGGYYNVICQLYIDIFEVFLTATCDLYCPASRSDAGLPRSETGVGEDDGELGHALCGCPDVELIKVFPHFFFSKSKSQYGLPRG